MLRIKCGMFAKSFIVEKEQDSFLEMVSGIDCAKVQVYTSLPGSVLNGGRPNSFMIEGNNVFDVVPPYHTKGGVWGELEVLEKKTKTAIERMNGRGIGVSLTLTNHLAEELNFDDYNLSCLDALAEQSLPDQKNDVTYTSDVVRDFVRRRYGKRLNLTASVLRFCAQPSLTYADGLREADDVVMVPQDVFDEAILESIPPADRQRVFIITNSGCRRACDKFSAHQHYLNTSRFNQGWLPGVDYRCHFEDYRDNCVLGSDDVMKLIDKGYCSFKVGRPDRIGPGFPMAGGMGMIAYALHRMRQAGVPTS